MNAAAPGPLHVGIVGVGAMGLAMAQRLRDGGHAVTVCDTDPARCVLAAAAGCAVVASPSALACILGAGDGLIVAVVDGAQTLSVLFDASDAAARELRPGVQVLLCPTIAPAEVEAAAARLRGLGVGVLDAPMSGGPLRARAGTMSLMVAGSDADFACSQHLLELLASPVLRVGTRPGDGARTKLVNNLLAAVNLAAAAEALGLAQRLGLDLATTLSVIEVSSGQSWIGSDRAHRVLAGDAAVRARLALLAKDSALALAMAMAVAVVDGPPADAAGGADALALGRAAAAAFAQALQAGNGDADDSLLIAQALDAGGPSAPEASRMLPGRARNAP